MHQSSFVLLLSNAFLLGVPCDKLIEKFHIFVVHLSQGFRCLLDHPVFFHIAPPIIGSSSPRFGGAFCFNSLQPDYKTFVLGDSPEICHLQNFLASFSPLIKSAVISSTRSSMSGSWLMIVLMLISRLTAILPPFSPIRYIRITSSQHSRSRAQKISSRVSSSASRSLSLMYSIFSSRLIFDLPIKIFVRR